MTTPSTDTTLCRALGLLTLAIARDERAPVQLDFNIRLLLHKLEDHAHERFTPVSEALTDQDIAQHLWADDCILGAWRELKKWRPVELGLPEMLLIADVAELARVVEAPGGQAHTTHAWREIVLGEIPSESMLISYDHTLQAVHSTRMSGGDMAPDAVDVMMQVARGQLTSAQARARFLGWFGMDAG